MNTATITYIVGPRGESQPIIDAHKHDAPTPEVVR